MFLKIPSLVLKQLYTFGSLQNVAGGVKMTLKNRLSDATLVRLAGIEIDGEEVPPAAIQIDAGDGSLAAGGRRQRIGAGRVPAQEVGDAPASPASVRSRAAITRSSSGSRPSRSASSSSRSRTRSPRRRRSGRRSPTTRRTTTPRPGRARGSSSSRSTPATSSSTSTSYSFDPAVTRGNIENFIGVAQVPIGLAGPLKINGEHAQGEFLIPLATTEGTLVASYNRGMKVLNLSGGVTCTVVGDSMQRAPVFVFDNAREARDFSRLGRRSNIDGDPRGRPRRPRSVAKLQLHRHATSSNKFVYLRFNYSTGDAAGQNMVGRATFAACSLDPRAAVPKDRCRKFYLESNFATDKKASQSTSCARAASA